MMQDQTAPAGAPQPPEQAPLPEDGGFEIVIRVASQGEITVNDQPVPDAHEAMELVQRMIDNGGQPGAAPAPSGHDKRREMDDAMEGYGSGGLRGLPVGKVLREDR